MKMQDGEEYILFLLKTVLSLCPLFTFGFGVDTYSYQQLFFRVFIYLFILSYGLLSDHKLKQTDQML